MNKNIKNFLDTNIKKRYNSFDGSHNEKHYEEVVEFGMNFYNNYKNLYQEINEDVLYATLALHDIGYKYGKENHDLNGSEMLYDDSEIYDFLSKYFVMNEIHLIAAAIKEHQGTMSSNIYSMILKDADNSHMLNINRRLERIIAFNKSKYPNITLDELISICYTRIKNTDYKCNMKENQEAFIKLLKDIEMLTLDDLKYMIKEIDC